MRVAPVLLNIPPAPPPLPLVAKPLLPAQDAELYPAPPPPPPPDEIVEKEDVEPSTPMAAVLPDATPPAPTAT